MINIRGLPPEPPTDIRKKVFWFIKVVGSFYGAWFSELDVMDRVNMPRTTVRNYLELFVEEDVLLFDGFEKAYRVKRRGE